MEVENKEYIVEKIKQIVLSKAPDSTIYLYGSRAKGTAKNDSDWDILILLNEDKVTSKQEDEVTSPLYELEFETGEIISPMVYAKTEWFSKYSVTSYFKNVMADGVEL